MFLDKLKLGTKLLLAPIFILVMMLGLSIFSLVNLNKISSSVDDIDGLYRIKTQEAGSVYRAIQDKKAVVDNFFNAFNTDSIKLFKIYNFELLAALNELKNIRISEENKAVVDEIENINLRYNDRFVPLSRKIIDSGGIYNVTDDEINKIAELNNKLSLISKRLEAESWGELARESKRIKSTTDTLSSSSIAVNSIALIFGLLVAVYVSFKIKKSVLVLSEAMSEISQGEADLTQRLTVLGQDELSGLAEAFNTFIQSIHDIVSEVKNSAMQIEASASASKLLISSTVQKIADQSTQTMSVASAVTELDASSAQVAQLTEEAKAASQTATENASVGNTVVDESINSMENISKDVNEATIIIQSLADNSTQIGTVSEVIKSIAEQTNLLALNAAIEAARAGEQGRGFAVVADEVRTLATRTHESTNEIQTIISSLQANTVSAVNVMESSQLAASDGVEHAKKAGDSLSGIVISNQSVTDLASQISHSTLEQSTVTSDVQRSINSIQSIAEETVNDSLSIEQSALEIEGVSRQLNELVRRFKT